MPVEKITLANDGFLVHGNPTIGYVKDDKLYLNSPEMRVMIDSESQIEGIKAYLPPGTRLFLKDGTKAWRLGADGEPAEIQAPTATIDGDFYIDPETMNLYYTSGGQ